MTKAQKAVGLGVAVLAGMAVAAAVQRHQRVAEVRPLEAVANLKTPAGMHVTGDPFDGHLCHQINFCTTNADGSLKCHNLVTRDIAGRDFRNATEEQAIAWIKEDASRALTENGMAACGGQSEDPFFRSAYAQPKCEDCGGGCVAASCPATVHGGGFPCTLGGVTCVITMLVCGGGVPPGCS